MKKLFCVLLLLCLFPAVCFSETTGLLTAYKMVFDATLYNEHFDAGFDYDMLAIDLYLMDDGTTVYYQKSQWSGNEFESTGLVRGHADYENKIYTVSFSNGFSFKFYRDGGNIWVNMNGGSFLLKPCSDFTLSTDFKTETI